MNFSPVSGLFQRAASGLSALGLGLLMGAVPLSRPLPAQAADPAQASQAEALNQLSRMFSPGIRATLDACQGRGDVNLEAGAGANGGVICGDGTNQPEVSYQNYLGTLSDFLAASTLLGMREQMTVNPEFTPEFLTAMLSSPEGRSQVQEILQSGLVQTGVIAPDSPAGLRFTNQIIDKLLPTVQRSNSMRSLLGTPTQYSQVVQQFCTAPGMPIEQAQQTFSNLSAVQLYAICIQESGLPR